MRDERRKEERSKQGQTNNKVKQHSTPKVVTFPKKNELHVHVPRVGLYIMRGTCIYMYIVCTAEEYYKWYHLGKIPMVCTLPYTITLYNVMLWSA